MLEGLEGLAVAGGAERLREAAAVGRALGVLLDRGLTLDRYNEAAIKALECQVCVVRACVCACVRACVCVHHRRPCLWTHNGSSFLLNA
jgi:hypothetical protein